MKSGVIFENLNLGLHNADLEATVARLEQGKSYRDLSTIIICPTRGMIPDRVVQSWMGLIRPMNQKVIGPIFFRGYEVGEAYTMAIDFVLSNPELSTWKYILTIEEDNLPPPDGLLKLYESMDTYDVVGGLYWTKGEGGQPMIYGDPKVAPLNFIPQKPVADTVQPANGLGMGFNLFKIEMFKDERLRKPWFKTLQGVVPGEGPKLYTQDLYFFEDAGKLGYKFACDTRVKVGHLDPSTDVIW
ncbi:MAG: hypothetical protein KBC38_01455 [Candidatus Pacebacteria bacterium]|nr:hypothetical protein [Candidatus Paceibacterota bacterium]MBP9840302.1 hypothetical protein [Candidatus Paceibacterota bacterium]